jgi:two-component system sensor histidine kinase KdpD
MAAWAAMLLLDGYIDLASLALILVLASAVVALWWPLPVSIAACAAAVLGFDYAFVPPRGTFTVDVRHDALLLVTMLVVTCLVALLVARQRERAAGERLHATRAGQLLTLGETLRDAEDPRACGARLQEALAGFPGADAGLMMLEGPAPPVDDPAAVLEIGGLAPDEQAGLWLSLREGRALGPGTGRYEEQGAWYLPMRGRESCFGAAVVRFASMPPDADAVRAHAQALCDQMGLALQRRWALRSAVAAREAADSQALRNTLLAAISHDYRTPLATILGAASSLHDQADRLSSEQRLRLAATIIDEANQLSRLTDNTLQLARLDAPGLTLHTDWESAEEIIGTVLRRVRQRAPAQPVKAHVARDLPLLRCDAVLLVQMLDNLVDNALRYAGPDAQVEIVARRSDGQVMLAVRDRGPGVAPEWRDRIFEVFQRVEPDPVHRTAADMPARRGAGVGLAVCRAIAKAHGGDLTFRARSHGGASFECVLPVVPPPVARGDDGAPGRVPA